MKYLLILTIGIAVAIQSCKQQDLTPTGNATPVYLFEGNIGTDSILMEAGNDSLYMYTDFTKDSLGLTTLQGNLRVQGNSASAPHLELLLNANAQLGSNYVYNNAAWNPLEYINSYSTDLVQQSSYLATFTAKNTNGVVGYSWYEGATLLGNSSTQVQTYTNAGRRNIMLVTNKQGLANDTTLQSVTIGAALPFSNIDIVSVDTAQLRIFASSIASAGTHTWLWGDGTSSVGIADSHIYATPGTYTITLMQTLGNDTHYARQIVRPSALQKAPGFDINIANSGQTTARVNLNSALLRWHKPGKVYSSYVPNTTDQSNKPVLKIKSFLPGPTNEKGQKTVILNCEADVMLYNTNNFSDSVSLKSKNFVIGVAVPQ